MRPDDLEFLIAQYADGSLDAKRSAELEAILRRDADARAVYDSYRAVDGALADVVVRQPVPEVQWDRLQTVISRRVTAVAAAGPIAEEKELAMSRLSSGDLSDAERQQINTSLTAEPTARLVLAEYAALDRLFDAVRSEKTPAVQWERFASHLSAEIDRSDESSAESLRIGPATAADRGSDESTPGVWGRIGNCLAQPRRLAVAACVILAASIGLRLANQSDPVPTTVSQPAPTMGQTPVAAGNPPPIDVRVGSASGSVFASGEAGVSTTAVNIGPPPSGGLDVTVLAEWAKDLTRSSQSIVGKAATRPEEKPHNRVENEAAFPPR